MMFTAREGDKEPVHGARHPQPDAVDAGFAHIRQMPEQRFRGF
jgi:hypothetical protein